MNPNDPSRLYLAHLCHDRRPDGRQMKVRSSTVVHAYLTRWSLAAYCGRNSQIAICREELDGVGAWNTSDAPHFSVAHENLDRLFRQVVRNDAENSPLSAIFVRIDSYTRNANL